MQELRLKQNLTQRLTPRQIQLIKLLQIPSIDIRARIEQELAENPVLEEGGDNSEEQLEKEEANQEEEVALADYLGEEAYKPQDAQRGSQARERQARREAAIPTRYSLNEQLLEQLHFLRLNERQHKIGEHLIGSLESDGYIRRDLEAIVNDLAFTQYIEADVQEVAAVLSKIQGFDPPGIGARNLQECLLMQLQKKKDSPARQLATQIITQGFEAFTKKHYDKLAKKLAIENPQLLQEALAVIIKLDPKPGGSGEASAQSQPLYPDFIVTKQNGQLQVTLTSYNTPELRVRKSYTAILEDYHKPNKKDKKLREAATFVKQKLEAARWFMGAIKQRQQTLLYTMQAIVKLQYDFFMEEEEQQLRPMTLKDVAVEIGMDVSTVSRITKNKSVQTDFGIYPLKFFFTEAISTTSGEEMSNRAVKKAVSALIQGENKQRPYTDDKLGLILQAKGYHIARRTVAKYREQLHIPVARLRKEV